MLLLSVGRPLREDLGNQLSVLCSKAASHAIHILNLGLFDLVRFDILPLHEVHHVDFAGVVAESPECLRMDDSPATSVHVVAGNPLNVLGEAHLEWPWREHIHGGRSAVLYDQSSLVALGDDATEPIEVVEEGI